jgi:hypothetical protein
LPFEVTHAGAIRGIDKFKNASGIISVGRLEPTVAEIQATARCQFYRSEEPLTFIQPNEEGVRRYPQVGRAIILTDGTEQPVMVNYHPAPRIDAVLRQIRDAAISQQSRVGGHDSVHGTSRKEPRVGCCTALGGLSRRYPPAMTTGWASVILLPQQRPRRSLTVRQ